MGAVRRQTSQGLQTDARGAAGDQEIFAGQIQVREYLIRGAVLGECLHGRSAQG
jgi:hypothetical protein